MRRACSHCGRIQPCAAHPTRDPNQPWSPNRDNAAHLRFRRAVKQRADHRCELCGSTRDLDAHHIVALAHGGTDDPSNGMCLCADCHRRVDRHARGRGIARPASKPDAPQQFAARAAEKTFRRCDA